MRTAQLIAHKMSRYCVASIVTDEGERNAAKIEAVLVGFIWQLTPARTLLTLPMIAGAASTAHGYFPNSIQVGA
jgi:hypothetical protein